MHIFDDLFEKQRKLEKERHLSLLKELNITEEEYQLRVKKRKEEADKIYKEKEKEKKDRIRNAIIIGAIFLLLFAIAYITHWGPIAMLVGLLVGFFLGVFVSVFLLDYLAKIKIFSWLDKVSDAIYVVFPLLGIVIGFCCFVGTYKFLTYEEGDDQVVYITPHGYRYHIDKDCSHIEGHKIIKTTFGNIKQNMKPCETCSGR